MIASRARSLAILAAGCWLAVGLPTRADDAVAPLPPLPEEVQADAVRQTAFASAEPTAPGPLPLAGPAAAVDTPPATRPVQPLGDWTVLLAIGGAFALLGGFRLRSLRRTKPLPPDVFELLGEGSLGGNHAVRVVRFGPRTLLIGVSTAGCQTLAEIDDPQASDQIAAACRGDRPPVRRPPPRVPATARPLPAGGEAA